MAHFRGIVQGNRSAASRLGHKGTGLTVEAQSWQGKVVVELEESGGIDYARVYFKPHNGTGGHGMIYAGPVDARTWNEPHHRTVHETPHYTPRPGEIGLTFGEANKRIN